MNAGILHLCVIILVILTGCKPSEVGSADELNTYVNEPANNLIHQTKLNGYIVEVTFQPSDLLVQKEIGDFPTEYTRLSTLQKKYSGSYYFILTISPSVNEVAASAAPAWDFDEKVQGLSQHLSNYVFLTTSSQDTVSLGEFSLSRTFGLSKGTDMLIVFNKEKSLDDEWIELNIREFGLGIGQQVFKFRVKDLEQVPRLKFAVVS